MKYLFKKYWYIILITVIINLPIFVLGITRTDKTITLPGDTTIVSDFVQIENASESEGSFETIFVMSIDHSTILQNLLAELTGKNEISDISESYLHFTDAELMQMGSIQHESSIIYSIILAYQEAHKKNSNIRIEYEFDSFVISYYGPNSNFRIGDKIIGVNNIYANDNFELFKESFNNMKLNDIFHVKRNENIIDITLDENNYNQIGGYAFYNIDTENSYPKYEIIPQNVGGPSGGLLQTLALYDALITEDITKGRMIAGTGTIDSNGNVGIIGGIQQKIYTAYADDIDIFLCPSDNYEEALIAYNKLPKDNKMKLYSVSTFKEALEVLENE